MEATRKNTRKTEHRAIIMTLDDTWRKSTGGERYDRVAFTGYPMHDHQRDVPDRHKKASPGCPEPVSWAQKCIGAAFPSVGCFTAAPGSRHPMPLHRMPAVPGCQPPGRARVCAGIVGIRQFSNSPSIRR